MIERLLSILAPHSCCSCGNLGAILCPSCKNDIISDPFSGCIVCLKPTAGDDLCGSCRPDVSIQGGWCVGARDDQLKNLLDRYKFDSAKQAGYVCAELLDARLPLLPAHVTVVPVPTSPAHRRVRGFDHTALFGAQFAKTRGLPYREALYRTNNRGAQHFKSRTERLRTAAEGLEIRTTSPEAILLVDDIYTTGATLRACIKKLREAGAKEIFVAIIARQTLDETSDLW